MAYTANQLITRAFYLSQVVSRELQTVDASEVSDGLYLLNALLDFKGTDLRLIPYFQEFDFPTIAQQEKYHVPNCYFIDSLTYNIGPVRYSMWDQSRKEYFASARVDQVYSLPFSYRPERTLGGMDVYLYFPPADVYLMKLWGKFALTDVTLNTDLTLYYDTYYIEYLRYALGEYICCEWGTAFPDAAKALLAQMQKKLLEVSPADLKIIKKSYFGQRFGWDWQTSNLTEGFEPF